MQRTREMEELLTVRKKWWTVGQQAHSAVQKKVFKFKIGSSVLKV